MRETATRRTRSPLRRPLLLVVLSVMIASASPERSAAVSADQLVVVDSPTDRSQVQRDVAGNVSVQLRLAEDADLSTFAASIGSANVASRFLIDPISRIGVASLPLAAGASYSLRVSVETPSRAGGLRGRRRDSDTVRFTVVEGEVDAGLSAAASNVTPTATPSATPTATAMSTTKGRRRSYSTQALHPVPTSRVSG